MLAPSREKVCLAIPTIDGRIGVGCVAGMIDCIDYWGVPLIMPGVSNLPLARNLLAHAFVEKYPECEWLQMVDSDMIFTRKDWEILWEGDEDIVSAEYARKTLGDPPAVGGLAFARVHRRVFEKLKDLTSEDGQEVVRTFYQKGEMYRDYFYNGVAQGSRFLTEDHGFLMYCSMTDAIPRFENRTRLGHVGSMTYCYPEQIPGYMKVGGSA
jgi:hypothetical protein